MSVVNFEKIAEEQAEANRLAELLGVKIPPDSSPIMWPLSLIRALVERVIELEKKQLDKR